jgi:hypothetical protein
VSARWLSQLAEITLANELGPNSICSVADVVKLMDQYVEKTYGSKHPESYLSMLDREYTNTVKKLGRQPRRGSYNIRLDSSMFGDSHPMHIKEVIDDDITNLPGRGANKNAKLSPKEADMVVDAALCAWKENGSCHCYTIIRSRLYDYIEHGISIERYR